MGNLELLSKQLEEKQIMQPRRTMGLGKENLAMNCILMCSPRLIVIIVRWDRVWEPWLPSWGIKHTLRGEIDTGSGQFLHPLINQHYLADRVVSAGPTPRTFDCDDVL